MTAWQSFYSIVGASAGALIGLQFVVIALVAGVHIKGKEEGIAAFLSPTVVHFAGALAVSAIMSAPWPSETAVAVAIAVCGLFGLAYDIVVFKRTRRQKAYEPVLEDWLWHAIFPSVIYAALLVAAPLARSETELALFIVAGGSLGLLFVGIRNAWDTVIYLVIVQMGEDEGKSQ
ncbi:MAG TPA: hypothetical protein VMD30_01710 [Tepidisphaeraceae bacterium]|nr:hypothetical protein [Tepidisphaeraceae bacterium]